ncbi:hypothetical protein ACF3NG_03930 [Aerococcaceae bacterium WGS1372]
MIVNKRGIVMIYVLIFLLFSQLLYWGILKINQINSLRYSDFQSHYQANIQESMTLNLIHQLEKENVNILENFINENIQINYRKNNHYKEDEWIELSPNHYLYLVQGDKKNTAFLFFTDIYMSLDLLDFCVDFKNQTCYGIIQPDNTLKRFNQEQHTYYNVNRLNNVTVNEQIDKELVRMGYQQVNNTNYRTTLFWNSYYNPELRVGTNVGETLYYQGYYRSVIETILFGNNFNRKHEFKISDNRIMIIWNTVQYVKAEAN